MKLYHGTTEAVARAALTRGLKPRADTGVESVWEDMPSRADMVYLSRAYALSFAMYACKGAEKWGVVEVDTDLMEESFFHPDEDFLEQATRTREDLVPPEYPMKLRTEIYRAELESYQEHWKLSLEGLGNCCYLGQVVPSEVTRVVIFDPTKSPTMMMMAADPQFSLINYAIMGNKYQALTDWLFGNLVSVGEFDPMFQITEWPEGWPGDMAEMTRKNKKRMEEALVDRSAIEMLMPAAEVGV